MAEKHFQVPGAGAHQALVTGQAEAVFQFSGQFQFGEAGPDDTGGGCQGFVQNMGGPADLVNLIGTFDHPLAADKGRQIQNGPPGEQLLLEAAVESGGHDVHFHADGAVVAQAELAQE